MNEGLSWKKWEKEGDKHLINRIRWDNREILSVNKVFESDWFGYGESNKLLEKRLSDFSGVKHFNLVNSGSSAIMVAVKSLINLGRVSPGDLVLHPVTTFATSISSAIDLGLVPVFVETKPGTYVIDPENVEKAIQKYPEIKGLIVPHLLGNVPDMERIVKALDGRFLIEDSCDTMGGKFNGKNLGQFSDFIAYSFYGSHHVTCGGGGGAIGTNSQEAARIVKSLIYWGRDFDAGESFLNRYKYLTTGTNTQLPALLAAFGLSQMGRIEDFIKERKGQYEELMKIFVNYSEYFELPVINDGAEPSWFGLPLVVKENSPFSREEFVEYLAKNHVEIRPIMCGNILNQEPFRKAKHISLHETFPIADKIENRGFFIPCWGMPENQKEQYNRIIIGFFEAKGL